MVLKNRLDYCILGDVIILTYATLLAEEIILSPNKNITYTHYHTQCPIDHIQILSVFGINRDKKINSQKKEKKISCKKIRIEIMKREITRA